MRRSGTAAKAQQTQTTPAPTPTLGSGRWCEGRCDSLCFRGSAPPCCSHPRPHLPCPSRPRPSPHPHGSHLLRGLFPLTQNVLVSYCCCNASPQTSDLQREIYHLAVLEIRVQNGSHRTQVQLRAGLRSFWRLQGRSIFLPSPACRHCPCSRLQGPIPSQLAA